MLRYLIRIALVVLVSVILVSAYQTSRTLASVGVSSPEAVEPLMRHFRVSTSAAFGMILPLIFIFDPFKKAANQNGPKRCHNENVI